MTDTLFIEPRFCGPPASGNGGYVSGRLARFLQGESVTVRLHAPPPLEKHLAVQIAEDSVSLFDGEHLLAKARVADREIASIESPGYEVAVEAAQRYRGFQSHPFPSCFVCGPDRHPQDGLRIFPGPVEAQGLVAAPWIPDASLASASGVVQPEFLWAALDCPGAFTFPEPEGCLVLLGEMQVRLFGAISVDERCLLVARELAHQGRKHHTVSALFGESGACRGVGLGTWIEIPAN